MTDDDVALYCALLVHLELNVFHSLWTRQSSWGGIRADESVLERVWVGLISVSLSSPFVFLWKTSFWIALQNVGVLLKGVFKPQSPFANASFYGLLNTFTDTWWVVFCFLGWERRLTTKAMFTCGWAGFSYHTSWNHCDLIKLHCCKADVRSGSAVSSS